jgi:hypothetical protein
MSEKLFFLPPSLLRHLQSNEMQSAKHRHVNKLQLLRYYITKVERGMDQSRNRGTELPSKFREGLRLLMRRLSRMRSYEKSNKK